jgi:hypothetical protein
LKDRGDIGEEDFLIVRDNSALFSMAKHNAVMQDEDLNDDDIYRIVEAIKQKSSEELKNVTTKNEYLVDRVNWLANKASKVIYYVYLTLTFVVGIAAFYYYGPTLSLDENIGGLVLKLILWITVFCIFITAYVGTGQWIKKTICPKVYQYIVRKMTG